MREPAIDLKHRQPDFDFEGVPALWSRVPEFALFFVAGSTGAPAVEPYLNRVMAQAKPMLKDPELQKDAEIFIKQETAHFPVHNKYNAEMARHFPFVVEAEAAKRKDYQNFLSTRSHKFNCGYSAGFETLALSMALFLFEQSDDMLEGADPRTVALWKWHLGEEYEHRAVCHEVYNAIYNDYFHRCYMVLWAFLHLAGHNKRIMGRLLAEYRKDLSPEQVAESIRREKAFKRRFMVFHLKHMLHLLTPGYSPRKVLAPRGLEAVLARYEPA
ncbi:MAG TPA: metal-dependent hydrolase [Caulobacteraceae bacterium]|nr:metal-dependent hydrolase [Caulobacteraceae bacterium]